MAKAMGYQPNPAARFLSSKRRLRISVNLPAQIASFWDTVREGIEEEARTFAAFGIDVEYRTFPRMGFGEQAAFDEALESEANGIIIATGRPQDLRLSILKASRARIPVVSVVTDAPGTARLAVVSIDSPASGALAGELLSRLLQGKGKVAVITGDLAIMDHAEKYNSFRGSVNDSFPAMRVLEPVQNHEDESEAYETGRALLREHPDLDGSVYQHRELCSRATSNARRRPIKRSPDSDYHRPVPRTDPSHRIGSGSRDALPAAQEPGTAGVAHAARISGGRALPFAPTAPGSARDHEKQPQLFPGSLIHGVQRNQQPEHDEPRCAGAETSQGFKLRFLMQQFALTPLHTPLRRLARARADCATC